MHLIYFVCLTWRCTPNSSKKICFVRRLLSPRSDQATMTLHKMTMYSKKWLDPDFVTSLSSTKCRSHLVLLRSSIEFVAFRDCCTQMKNELETKTFTRIEKKVARNAFFRCCSNHFCISLIFKSDEVSQTRCKTGFSLASNLCFCKSRFVLCFFVLQSFEF